nr:hypothetical protein [Rhodospira trueperi]
MAPDFPVVSAAETDDATRVVPEREGKGIHLPVDQTPGPKPWFAGISAVIVNEPKDLHIGRARQ